MVSWPAVRAMATARRQGACLARLQQGALNARAQQALADLARFRDVMRLEVRAEDGTVLWRNFQSVSRVKRQLPTPGNTLMERRNIDGLSRMLARHHAPLSRRGTPGCQGH